MVLCFLAGIPSFAQGPAIGDWSGRLLTPAQEMRIRFHIEEQDEGLVGTMDSPDQDAFGIELDTVMRSDDSLRILIEDLSAEYKGVFLNGDSLEGEWIQLGRSYPLNLAKGVELSASSREQTPEAPYPYRSVDTVFSQRTDGIRLAGTITLPEGDGPFPGLVLVSGSGPQDRDETIAQHKPFHVIADRLTKSGFAVLRYDDRGVAGSEGEFQTNTIADFVEDARAAYRFLKGYPKVNDDKVGMLGHSEGGMVASRLAASKEDDPAFLVFMASPALRGDSILITQNRAILSKRGMKAELVDAQVKVLDSITTYIRNGRDPAFVDQRTRESVEREFGGFIDSSGQARLMKRYKQYSNVAWFRSFIKDDPSRSYRKLDLPVLALFGENDLQVLPGPNARKMRNAFEEDEDLRIEVIPGVNHLFQPDSSGLPSRYGRIDTTIHPPVLELLEEWSKEQ